MSLDAYITREPIAEPEWTCDDCGRTECACIRCESCGDLTPEPVRACVRCIAEATEDEPVGFDLEAAYDRLGIKGTYVDGTTR